MLKTAELCAAQPEQAARQRVEAGFARRYQYALQTLTEVRNHRWREYDMEDSLRFYALRLHDAGMFCKVPRRPAGAGGDRQCDACAQHLRAG